MGSARPHPARWWRRLEGGRVRCELCPRDCVLKEGQRGHCFVRANRDGALVLTTYGRSSGFCVDPIEKKPLNHFHPGSAVLSFGTAGCNLACRFCQNWDISRSRDTDTLAVRATPEQIAARAEELGCRSVAFTYNDPVIFAEYAIDTARACHARGIETVAVTAGYVHAEPRAALFAHMDAANVDLKGFRDPFYQELCRGHLEPVLDTLRYLVHETACWVEITTLLIPGWNDGDGELRAEAAWIRDELSSVTRSGIATVAATIRRLISATTSATTTFIATTSATRRIRGVPVQLRALGWLHLRDTARWETTHRATGTLLLEVPEEDGLRRIAERTSTYQQGVGSRPLFALGVIFPAPNEDLADQRLFGWGAKETDGTGQFLPLQ